MPNVEHLYFTDFSRLRDCVPEESKLEIKGETKNSLTAIIREYFIKECASESIAWEDVFAKFGDVLRCHLFKDQIHFSDLDLPGILEPLGLNASRKQADKLEDLAENALFRKFFGKCLEVFGNPKISDEILFKGLFNDYLIFAHFMMNPGEKEINRNEHNLDFLNNNQGLLGFFNENFNKARELALDRKAAPLKILRGLNLCCISMEALMNLEGEFFDILSETKRKAKRKSQRIKGCHLCEEVDAMEFLREFFCFAEGVKSIFIPRYVLLAIIATKALRIHLVPFAFVCFRSYPSDFSLIEISYYLFFKEARIEFEPNANKGIDTNEVLKDVFSILMLSQFTTPFYKYKNNGRAAYSRFYPPIRFYNYGNEPSHIIKDHDWCFHPYGHEIDDQKLIGDSLSSIIMLTIIAAGALRNHLNLHNDNYAGRSHSL